MGQKPSRSSQRLHPPSPLPPSLPCRVNGSGGGGPFEEDKPLVAGRGSRDLEEEEEGGEEPSGTPEGEGPAEKHVGGATDLKLNCNSSPPR